MRSEETIHGELGVGDGVLGEPVGDDEEDRGICKKPRE